MTVRFVADEHIARRLVVGLRRLAVDVDIVGVQDVGLRTLDDPTILEWAADHRRALLTQDIRTMPDFAPPTGRHGPSDAWAVRATDDDAHRHSHR